MLKRACSVFVKLAVLSVLVVTVAAAGCGHGNDGVDGAGPGSGGAAGPDGGGGAGGTAGTTGKGGVGGVAGEGGAGRTSATGGAAGTGGAGGASGKGGAGGTSGCATPPVAPSGHAYYADPVNGAMSNDGSQSKPWGSLSAIIAAKKLPPSNGATVQPGDAVYLMTGSHGDVSLNAANPDFITLAAAAGQTPMLSSLKMDSASHWILSGLTVQALNNGGYVFGIRVDGSDLVLEGNAVLSQADVSAWTQSDWQTKALYYAINASGNCISLLNNRMTNVKFGVGISGTNLLVRGNTIDHFGDDGIDFGQGTGSGTIGNIEISGNVITNNLDIGDGNHNDGIQGWVLNGTTGHDVTIESNVVIVKTDPNLPWKGSMQGISEFDGAWDGIQITNNVVMAAAYHGIALYGAHNSTIINNTVFGNFVAPNGDVNETWIGVFDNGGSPPVNVVVRNNISGLYSLAGTGVTADHNVLTTNPQTNFVQFNRTTFQYDLHPAPGSVQLGYGSTQLAPAYDITGAQRVPPITAGAYQ